MLVFSLINYSFALSTLSCFNFHGKKRIHQTAVVESEFNSIVSQNIPRARKQELRRALDMANAARRLFENSGVDYPERQNHYRVAKATALLREVEAERQKEEKRLKLTAAQSSVLCKSLQDAGEAEISFSMFCRLLARALSGSLDSVRMSKWMSQKAAFDLYTSVYIEAPAEAIAGEIKEAAGGLQAIAEDAKVKM